MSERRYLKVSTPSSQNDDQVKAIINAISSLAFEGNIEDASELIRTTHALNAYRVYHGLSYKEHCQLILDDSYQ